MNRRDASKIAETITNQELKDMFDVAKAGIKNWSQRSDVNKGMTKGAAWNILHKAFDVNKKIPPLAKKNMVWEFGDFLPKDMRPAPRRKINRPEPTHQEPKF